MTTRGLALAMMLIMLATTGTALAQSFGTSPDDRTFQVTWNAATTRGGQPAIEGYVANKTGYSYRFIVLAVDGTDADTQTAYAGWIRRHAGYLRLSTMMNAGFAAAAAKDQTEKGAEARKVLEYGPRQIEKMSTLLVEVIAEMPSEDAKKQMCSETVAKVESRAFDLENTDPELTKYL